MSAAKRRKTLPVVRIGGVPEHFNYPLHMVRDLGLDEKHGVRLEFVEVACGTGAMIVESNIFTDEQLFSLLPEEYSFIEDLWLTYYCAKRLAMKCEFFAADLDLLVANPDGYSFWLEESPIEGGHYFERCGGCAPRGRCGGVREE